MKNLTIISTVVISIWITNYIILRNKYIELQNQHIIILEEYRNNLKQSCKDKKSHTKTLKELIDCKNEM